MTSIHAGCVLVGETGILIRGPSGAGKSSLAAVIIAESHGQGRFACLVADDRVALTAAHGRLIARPVAPLEGLIEQRGYGLCRLPFAPGAVVRLVVDLGVPGERLPDAVPMVCVAGITLPLIVAGSAADAVSTLRLVLAGVAPSRAE